MILSETTEFIGAEHALMARMATKRMRDRLLRMVKQVEERACALGVDIVGANPAPGNLVGGITTIEEKSLGCVFKAGTSPIREILAYAERPARRGLVIMDTPGNDVSSVTGMIAGGANMTCFTTGRGSVCGFKPVPTIKLASNTAMYRRMKDDMDVNCGKVVDGEKSVKDMGAAVFDMILAVASGRKTKSEELGFGDAEFVPWQMGAVL